MFLWARWSRVEPALTPALRRQPATARGVRLNLPLQQADPPPVVPGRLRATFGALWNLAAGREGSA